ncbi:hypothetical protein ACUOA8_17735, partial [Escherichia sp. SS-MK2]
MIIFQPQNGHTPNAAAIFIATACPCGFWAACRPGSVIAFSLARVRGNTPVLPFISLFSCNYSG